MRGTYDPLKEFDKLHSRQPIHSGNMSTMRTVVNVCSHYSRFDDDFCTKKMIHIAHELTIRVHVRNVEVDEKKNNSERAFNRPQKPSVLMIFIRRSNGQTIDALKKGIFRNTKTHTACEQFA